MWQGLAAAGVNLLGGIFSNNAQAAQAAEANRFSAEQAKAQMDFQERMRATQYQTATEDLMKAGLNPMLAYTQGGAGTPAGASATGQQAQIRNPVEGGASAASLISNIEADLALKTSQVDVNKENVKNISADTMLKLLNDPKIRQETKNLIQQEMLLREQTAVASAQKTYTSALEAVERNKAMIQRLGEIPEARSKGKYFNEFPSAYQLKEQAQVGSSAAGIIDRLSGAFNRSGTSTGLPRPKNPISRPTPSRR
jgi:hypothetical protein